MIQNRRDPREGPLTPGLFEGRVRLLETTVNVIGSTACLASADLESEEWEKAWAQGQETEQAGRRSMETLAQLMHGLRALVREYCSGESKSATGALVASDAMNPAARAEEFKKRMLSAMMELDKSIKRSISLFRDRQERWPHVIEISESGRTRRGTATHNPAIYGDRPRYELTAVRPAHSGGSGGFPTEQITRYAQASTKGRDAERVERLEGGRHDVTASSGPSSDLTQARRHGTTRRTGATHCSRTTQRGSSHHGERRTVGDSSDSQESRKKDRKDKTERKARASTHSRDATASQGDNRCGKGETRGLRGLLGF
jgi:hypothetical protein